jgi:1,4-alpha-glucan branching enzyme
MSEIILDFGYDISDYEAIQPEYGTMEDFDELIVKAKQLGKERTGICLFLLCMQTHKFTTTKNYLNWLTNCYPV